MLLKFYLDMLFDKTEVTESGINNWLKCCSEPELDWTVCNKVHVHTNVSIHRITEDLGWKGP